MIIYGEPICFITPINYSHKAGDGLATRRHNISNIHPTLQANPGSTQMTYLMVEPNETNKSDNMCK